MSSWAGWRFHPGAGTTKNGPTLDKPQTKVWRAHGSWWAILARDEHSPVPELAIFELVESSQRWRDSGTLVSNDPLATADALSDGCSLWVATRAPQSGIALQRFGYDDAARRWAADDEGSWRLRGISTPSISIGASRDGEIFLTYTDGGRPWYGRVSPSAFPELDGPYPIPGARATLKAVDLGAVVALKDEIGILWSDQGQESFFFAICSPDGSWRTEVPASGGLVADDHIAIRTHQDRIYVAVKTSRDDDPPRASDDSLIMLLVRETTGDWHSHQVVSIRERATRPIPLIEPDADLIHVLYTLGPNPGERTIRRKTASLTDLAFNDADEVVIGAKGAQINNVTSSREPLNSEHGAVLLASDGPDRRYYFAHLQRSVTSGGAAKRHPDLSSLS